MNKHTPGPWFPVVNEYGNIEIVTDERPYIHTVVSENECLNAADARLIAAAPEMLALLDQAHSALQMAIDSKKTGWFQDAVLADIGALLSRIEGETK